MSNDKEKNIPIDKPHHTTTVWQRITGEYSTQGAVDSILTERGLKSDTAPGTAGTSSKRGKSIS